jgi:hypothetical protein
MARPAGKRLTLLARKTRAADLIATRRGEAALLAAACALASVQRLGRRTVVVARLLIRLIARGRLALGRLRNRGAGRERQRSPQNGPKGDSVQHIHTGKLP